MSSPATASKTPLYGEHVALGGRMVEFAGAVLPVQYKGVIAESQAVRARAGMFDVSHMARLSFTGDRVLEYLEHVTANDVSKLADMEGQYSLLPNANGGCVDDIIVYRLKPGEYHMVVNAANHAKDVAHLKSQNTFGVEIRDYTDSTAMIAVQGPEAHMLVASLADNPNEILSTEFFGCVTGRFSGQDVFMARSGYTGEDGFELICQAGFAAALWQELLGLGVEPCGLGSRDTLRVEAGLPLYGHELTDTLSPIAAGLGWVVSKTKSFLGSEPINKARAEGTRTKLQGIKMDSKRLPMPGMSVLAEGREVGEVSSGVYSPLLECGIGFAFLEPSIKIGTPIEVDVRGTRVSGTVESKRFFKR